jgi:hypothetical protein
MTMKKTDVDLSALSTEELTKRAKTTKAVTISLAVIILIQFAVGTYLTIQKGFGIFTIIPITFLPMLIINFGNIKKMKEEIAKRS